MKRPLVLVIISFILGILFMNIKRTIFYMVLLFCVAFLLINRRYFRKHNREYLICYAELKKEKEIRLFVVMLVSLLFGYMYANVDYINKFDCINRQQGKEVQVNGVIVSKEDNEYLLKNVYIDGEKVKGKIKVRSNNEYNILEEVSAKVVLDLPSESMNFGAFNYRQYLYSKNILSVGQEVQQQNKIGIKLSLIEQGSIRIREYIVKVIDEEYPKNEAQILKAILIGESSTLEDDIKEFYQKAGIIHVLVVSGAHIALIIVSLKVLLDKMKFSKRWHNFVLIFLIIIYVYITGAGESIVRAGVVSIIALMAGILGRQNDNITTIFFSAGILALINPMMIYSVGFQLSFAGALGIVVFNNRIKEVLTFLPKSVSEAVSVTISAQLLVLPITAYHFNSVNLIGVISSLVVMPIINLIMPLGFVGIVPIIREVIVKANYFLINLLFECTKIFAYVNVFEITVATPKIFYIVIYYVALFVALLDVDKKSQKFKWIAIVCIGFFILYGISDKNLEINFLYVGHGDSIFIVTPKGKTILIDTGDNYLYKDKEYNMAKKNVVPFILDKGYKHVDLMILSHLDADHAGGVETIVENLTVKQVVIGKNSIASSRFTQIQDICSRERIEISLVGSGNSFYIDDIKFNVLSPFQELNETENNNSIVILMEYKNKKVLFMGDLEAEGEKILLGKYSVDADVLKVGHHGSVTSSTEELIDEVTPDISIISVGDRFTSLPSKEVLNRLKESDTYITKEDGGICLTIGKKGDIEIQTAKF